MVSHVFMSELIASYCKGIDILTVTRPREIGSCLEADLLSIDILAKYSCFY